MGWCLGQYLNFFVLVFVFSLVHICICDLWFVFVACKPQSMTLAHQNCHGLLRSPIFELIAWSNLLSFFFLRDFKFLMHRQSHPAASIFPTRSPAGSLSGQLYGLLLHWIYKFSDFFREVQPSHCLSNISTPWIIWQGLSIRENICPDASRKIWRFAGSMKYFLKNTMWKLLSRAFQWCITLYSQKWTVWPWDKFFCKTDFLLRHVFSSKFRLPLTAHNDGLSHLNHYVSHIFWKLGTCSFAWSYPG